MRIYQSRERAPNSAANPLPARFWRTKFRCQNPHQFYPDLLSLLLLLVIWDAFGTAKRVFSLSSGTRPLFGGGEVRALPAQFGDPLPGVEVGPVDECEVGDLARVVGAIGDADLLAGDVDGADPALVLQQADVAERREIERDEIGRPARFETPMRSPSVMKPALTSVAARNAAAGVKPRSSTKSSSSRAFHSP